MMSKESLFFFSTYDYDVLAFKVSSSYLDF